MRVSSRRARPLLDEAWTSAALGSRTRTIRCCPSAEKWPLRARPRLLPRHLETSRSTAASRRGRARFPGRRGARAPYVADRRGGESGRNPHSPSRRCEPPRERSRRCNSRLRARRCCALADMLPLSVTNVTNGVTHGASWRFFEPAARRSSPEAIGDGWLRDLDRLRQLGRSPTTPPSRMAFAKPSREQGGSGPLSARDLRPAVDPRRCSTAVQRIHEYKRHHLNVTSDRAVDRIRDGKTWGPPHEVVIAGKAAPRTARRS